MLDSAGSPDYDGVEVVKSDELRNRAAKKLLPSRLVLFFLRTDPLCRIVLFSSWVEISS
jgi:hypothetical protein